MLGYLGEGGVDGGAEATVKFVCLSSGAATALRWPGQRPRPSLPAGARGSPITHTAGGLVTSEEGPVPARTCQRLPPPLRLRLHPFSKREPAPGAGPVPSAQVAQHPGPSRSWNLGKKTLLGP